MSVIRQVLSIFGWGDPINVYGLKDIVDILDAHIDAADIPTRIEINLCINHMMSPLKERYKDISIDFVPISLKYLSSDDLERFAAYHKCEREIDHAMALCHIASRKIEDAKIVDIIVKDVDAMLKSMHRHLDNSNQRIV